MTDITVAESIVARLAAHGVRYIFGVPGGDCNLDIIEAGERHGVEFVLTRSETPAAMMASVVGELTGVPGVVMTTRGPGLANGVNGIAYASLDRSPLLVIADAYEDHLGYVSHQRIDHAALLQPLLKKDSRLDADDVIAEVDALMDAATAQPPGPVYMEIHGKRIRAIDKSPQDVALPVQPRSSAACSADIAEAKALLSRAKRPIVIVGLQAREARAAAALRRFIARTGFPSLATYKAKGVVSDADDHALGSYIDGAAERPAIEASDLIILYGFDPIEGPPTAWRHKLPVIEITKHVFERPLFKADVSLVGDLAATIDVLAPDAPIVARRNLAAEKGAIRDRAGIAANGGISPNDIVEAAGKAFPQNTRITVDAGAHMMPVLHLWSSLEPNSTLVSRGLATMGFALPAAIASAIVEPDRPVVAFTGDGGLMMCASELATAVQRKCKLVVVVFNDSCLTLIWQKQRRRQLPNAGVDLTPVNFASIAQGYGCAGFRVEKPQDLAPALSQALAADGPAVVDIVVDPQLYYEQIISLRG
jgi:acetolactate synthase-1/2/3 large subunit